MPSRPVDGPQPASTHFEDKSIESSTRKSSRGSVEGAGASMDGTGFVASFARIPWANRRTPMVAKSDGDVRRSVYKVATESRPRPGCDFYGIPNPPSGQPLRLTDLRERLIRQEETIIFALIERAQFRLNPVIYCEGAFELPRGARTFSEYLLHELEAVYAKVRRYTSPDEHPFSNELPAPILPELDYPHTLCANDINFNGQIKEIYRSELLPRICEHGDDQNYGSSATADVACLQALSKRIHYGKFIAEAKVQDNPELYKKLVRDGNNDAIWGALSDDTVEEKLLTRVRNKARSYGSDITVEGSTDVYKVDPNTIALMYRDFIIPLTKTVEVEYILVRCG